MFKKVLYGLGVFFAVILFILIIGGAVMIYQGNQKSKEGYFFMMTKVTPLITNWNESAIYSYASDDFKQQGTPSDYHNWISTIKEQLGNAQECGNLQGSQPKFSYYSNKTGINVYIQYQMTCRFEKAHAVVSVSLHQNSGAWLIDQFNIDSPVFYATKN